jgi:HPt (histidine-containing phosphotransfer) domain-containing protein
LKAGKKHSYVVDADLKVIMPKFLLNRRKDARLLKQFFTEQNWVSMSELAHQIRGSSFSYGFKSLSDLGAELEELAINLLSKTMQAKLEESAVKKIKTLLKQLDSFNKNVKVKYKKSA